MNNKFQDQIIKWPGLEFKKNFFSAETLKKINLQISKAVFEEVYQERESHYSHVFKSSSNRITESGETYISKYFQANDKDTIKFLKKILAPIIGNEIKKKMPNIKNIMTPQLMRFSPGSFLRMHVDDYAGEIGFTIFINDGWKWDYGGILNFVSENGEKALPIFPESNMALIRDESQKSFHYVSQQAFYSNSNQFLLVGWASDKVNHERFNYFPISK